MRRRVGSLLALLAVLGAIARVARAQPAALVGCADREVRITRVGYGSEWAALEAELSETLRAHGLCVRFESRPQLTIDAVRKLEPTAPAVWVELLSAERARLVLTDARRGRYLLRDVPLTNGLDGVGREALSQVIEASLLALRGEAPVLDGAQLERLMADSGPPSAAAPVAPPPSTRLARQEPPAPPPQAIAGVRTSYGLRLAPSYSFQWTGADLGPLHGLGVSVSALRAFGKAGWTGVSANYTAHASQHFASRLVGLRTQRQDAWLTARLELPVSTAVSFVSEVGAGLAWTRVAPRSVRGGIDNVASATVDRALWLRVELGLEYRLHALGLQATALNDVSTHDTHYDVTLLGARNRLVTPWLFSPGGRLALSWRY